MKRGMGTIAVLFVGLLCLWHSPIARSALISPHPPRILFISPTYADHPFWRLVEHQMHYAAADFGFELNVEYGNDSPLRVTRLAIQALDQAQPPDFLLLQFNGPVMPTLLPQIERHDVRLITFNSPPSPHVQARIGQPGTLYRHWLAHLWPDDQLAGRLEAEALLRQAQQRWPNTQHTLLAFNGARSDISLVAQHRGEGLRQAIAAVPTARLAQEFAGYWNADKATHPLQGALQRYPDARVLWSGSDEIALRLRELLIAEGKPLDEYLIAGIDATPQGLAASAQGQLVTTVGGHFMEGAWCMVLIYDYLQQDRLPANRFMTAMYAFDRQGIGQLRQLQQSAGFSRLDYHVFSYSHFRLRHGEVAAWHGYPFDWPAVLQQAREQHLLSQ